VTLSALLLGAFCFGRATGSAAAPRGPQRVVVVHAGDTLWSIARRAAPSSDPRAEVARITAANHLATSDLAVGQRLVLPQP
jgi:LysM repeat protein